MFKQITNLNGDEIYMITSLWIFIIFFVVVGLMLFFMKKDHIEYMKSIPLEDTKQENNGLNEDRVKL